MTLISREDAIERIANDNVVGGMKRINEYRDSTEHNDYLDGISTAIATVDDLPSAEAEPVKHGKWKVIIKTEDEMQAKCSECKMVYFLGMGRNPNYCPNCGAKMDKEIEDNGTE